MMLRAGILPMANLVIELPADGGSMIFEYAPPQ